MVTYNVCTGLYMCLWEVFHAEHKTTNWSLYYVVQALAEMAFLSSSLVEGSFMCVVKW